MSHRGISHPARREGESVLSYPEITGFPVYPELGVGVLDQSVYRASAYLIR